MGLRDSRFRIEHQVSQFRMCLAVESIHNLKTCLICSLEMFAGVLGQLGPLEGFCWG